MCDKFVKILEWQIYILVTYVTFLFIYFWCKSKMWNIKQNKTHQSFFVIIIVKKRFRLVSGQLQVSVQHNFWHQFQKATSSYFKANFDVFKRSYQFVWSLQRWADRFSRGWIEQEVLNKKHRNSSLPKQPHVRIIHQAALDELGN